MIAHTRVRRLFSLATIGVLLMLLGCAGGSALRPASNAEVSDRGVKGATDLVAVFAHPDDWAGLPRQIDGYTPVRVRVKNNGDQPVRLRYSDFVLAAPDSSVTPVDPRSIEGTEYVSPGRYGYGANHGYARHGFHAAPHHTGLASVQHGGHGLGHGIHGRGHGFGRGIGLGFGHGRGLGYGFGHGGYHGGYSRAVELPSRDMLATAIPEGSLKPGGRIDGFLYFPTEAAFDQTDPSDSDAPSPAPLTVSVVHAETDDTIGKLSLPFVYER